MAWTTADIPSLDGRCAIVTGVGGIGFEVGAALTGAGATVIMAGRNPAEGVKAVAALKARAPNTDVTFELLDLADLASVKAFAGRMLDKEVPIDILVNNAGIMNPPVRSETADGFELQFGINYLGHFALTLRLMPLLLRASDPRVISVSSVVHRRGRIDFDDLQAQASYRPHLAYAQSKLAMLLFARELDRRVTTTGHASFASIAAHPGIARTNLFKHSMPGVAGVALKLLTGLIAHSASAGAAPIVMAATAPDVRGGDYYGPTGFSEMKGPPGKATVAPQGSDTAVARRLFDISETLTGVTLAV